MGKYRITGWNQEDCLKGKTFETFEEACAFVRELEKDETNSWQEYSVERCKS